MDISVVEYLHILNPFYYYISNNKNPKKPKNHYYDRVYLCVEKDNLNASVQIKGFNCFRCNNFEEADAEYNKKFSKHNNRSAMIPICKFVPIYFDPYIINFKLNNTFGLWNWNYTFYKKNK